MFYTNVGYQWKDLSIPGPHGAIFRASGTDRKGALDRPRPEHCPGEIFFDPQLYFISFPVDISTIICIRLASYGWFEVDLLEYDSNKQSRKDWQEEITKSISGSWPPRLPTKHCDIREQVEKCIAFQQKFGVSTIILPAPLTNDVTSDLSVELSWVDIGLEALKGKTIPSLATFAISDMCLLGHSPDKNRILQIAIDQFSARDELQGIYLVIAQTQPKSKRITDEHIASSLLEFCYYVGEYSHKTVIVNYADVFGIVCLAAGANAFAGGTSQKDARLHFRDFKPRGGGGAFPRFYSHTTICDYRPQHDLPKLKKRELLRLIQSDQTPASKGLFEALKTNQDISQLPDWREDIGNLPTAKNHFFQKIRMVVDDLNTMSSIEKKSVILAWLQDADRTVTYLNTRFSENDDSLTDIGIHIKPWCSAFEKFLKRHQ